MKPYSIQDLTKEELIAYIMDHIGFVPQRDLMFVMVRRKKTKATQIGNRATELFEEVRKNGYDSAKYKKAMDLQDQSWAIKEDADALWEQAMKMGREG